MVCSTRKSHWSGGQRPLTQRLAPLQSLRICSEWRAIYAVEILLWLLITVGWTGVLSAVATMWARHVPYLCLLQGVRQAFYPPEPQARCRQSQMHPGTGHTNSDCATSLGRCSRRHCGLDMFNLAINAK
ncbi:hypothetical protein PMIN01_09711 [Paraphaeosphaeria minitans]|uniref:Uncharacterized protein n=1 Tax=Paraphaeosphaeria minitans TaxID=565426 RepID=A0A9P6KMB6_9PLEO|nr:hypothetical protein PMIN01_09711 [Paraphaeosphaeria minitans]